MSNPLLDASTQALLDELARRGEEQARLAQSQADARRDAKQVKAEALRKERAWQRLSEEWENEQRFADTMKRLKADKARLAKVTAMNARKREEVRQTISFMALAESDWMPTGEMELDGSSRWDDLDNTIPYDMKAEDVVEGSAFKLALAQSLNASSVSSEGTGATWRLLSQWQYAIGQNRFYQRYVTENPMHVGDNHKLSNGERGVVSCVLIHEDRKAPAFDSADGSATSPTYATFYAVEWTKRWIDLTKQAGQKLWLKVNFGRQLPTMWDKQLGKKVIRPRAFIYEPVRYIRIGNRELEIESGIADEVEPIFDEDGSIVNQDEINSFANGRRNLPSMSIQSTADQAVDIAYWWAEELRTLDYAVSSGDVEGYTIPGARQYGSDKAIHVETLTHYAQKHGWTVTDLDMWVKRRRGLNPNCDPITKLRALLPE